MCIAEKSESLFHWEQEHIVGLSGSSRRNGLVFSKGKGCYLEDLEGRKYLDFTAGVGIMSVGHCHPRFVHAVQEQVGRLVGFHDATSKARVELFQLLSMSLPERLGHFAMFSGGTETVEAALRFARVYTGRSSIIGFWGGFHGKTLGAMAVSGHDIIRRQWPLTIMEQQLTIPYAYCYRCPLRLNRRDCNICCAEFGFKLIDQHCSVLPAAVIVEPMQGTQGNIVPPKEFVQAISDWCRERGVILILDEILTGCARTGRMFAFEHYEVEPDILLLGKGLGAGYPVGIVVLSEELASHSKINCDSAASSSFGGNPVAAIAAKTTLEIISEEDLMANANEVGRVLLHGCRELQARHSLIGDVRGLGMLIGVELVKDRKSRDKATSESEAVVAAALRRGLLLMSSAAVLRINPPLVLDDEQAQTGLAILDEALSDIESTM